jgi:hypothetical protein
MQLKRTMLSCTKPAVLLIILLCVSPIARSEDLGFERVVVDDDFPGAYQVEVADVNGDKKLDIIAVGGGTCAWYENPTWKKRLVSTPRETPGIISSATADLDGDGKAEIAIAFEFEMAKPLMGKLLLAAQGSTVDEPWSLKPLADVGSIHRLRWLDFGGERKHELVVAPIFGPNSKSPDFQDPASLTVFRGDFKKGALESICVSKRPVMHAIRLFDDGRKTIIFTADNRGIGAVSVDLVNPTKYHDEDFLPGDPGVAPKSGASEIQTGKLASGLQVFVTIEPWHGNKVVVNLIDPKGTRKPAGRTVIDETLEDGHALWTADVDGDGNSEIFAGHRGKNHRVSMFQFDGKTWNRTVIDTSVAAQDLRGGDIDGDGTPDIVAVGGATQNVVWYRPLKK